MKRWTYKQAKELEIFESGEHYVVIDSDGDATTVIVEYDDSTNKIWLLETWCDEVYTPSDNCVLIPVNSLI